MRVQTGQKDAGVIEMTGFYAYVVAKAKKGTNMGVFRIPLKSLPEYNSNIMSSMRTHNVFPGHPLYNAILRKTADYINTTPDNVDFPTSPEISTEDFPPEFYNRAQKSKYEKGNIGYFGAKKPNKKSIKLVKKIPKKLRK